MPKNKKMYEQIKKHGENLNAIFATPYDPVSISRKLRRLETRMHRAAEDWCNGTITEVELETIKTSVRTTLVNLLNPTGVDLVINTDPRGYALKISDEWMRAHPKARLERDWGGYGILAPDFSGEE
jgi:hypothetical protein